MGYTNDPKFYCESGLEYCEKCGKEVEFTYEYCCTSKDCDCKGLPSENCICEDCKELEVEPIDAMAKKAFVAGWLLSGEGFNSEYNNIKNISEFLAKKFNKFKEEMK
jgi:hypothetical protein